LIVADERQSGSLSRMSVLEREQTDGGRRGRHQGPGPRDIVMRRRPTSDITRLAHWTRQHHWSAQIVLLLGCVANAALTLVFELLLGAGMHG
jgi:hypothetical protein